MAEVTYDDRSFLVNGSRVWLISGSLHYFRVPAALWRDRLLKAKRAGLNCISTYVAWNFHEPEEGRWRLDGDQDIVEFVQLAEELGLYVILRPGPYICAEWDFGGLPGWLTAKQGVVYRTNNAAYTHYYDKYLAKLLPRLADQQVTHGGNILLIQNENEYMMTTMPDRQGYLDFISQLFRRSGFDIPIITCNLLSEPFVPDAVECANGWDRIVQELKRLRLHQPDRPLLATEYWDGWFDAWGTDHQTRPAREVARRAMQMLGCGAQINYYMWHGGTNFEFWGSRLVSSDASYQTTSYDFDAPLAEGGGLTEKYYRTRLVNLLASRMAPFFAGARSRDPGATVHDATDVTDLAGPAGRWAVVTNTGQQEIATVELSLADGTDLTVPLEPLGAAAIPSEMHLSDEHVLDYANLTPLGLFGEKTLVLHGPAGFAARVSVNGTETTAEVPGGEEPEILDCQGLRVVLVSSELAMRTWFTDEGLAFGPSFVGETLEDVRPDGDRRKYLLLPAEGEKLETRAIPPAEGSAVTPRLGSWSRVAVCTEPVSDELEWEKLDRPRDLDRLGIHYGYGWYRIELDRPRAKKHNLFLPECEDRATIYLNGELIGTWGRGPDAVRSPIPATFKKGANTLTMLVDNLGRLNFGSRLGERKGLFGHVYDAKPLRSARWKLTELDAFSRRVVPRTLAHLTPQLQKLPVFEATANLTLNQLKPIHLSFADLPAHAAVLCNERNMGFFERHARNFGDVMLAPALKKGRNQLKLILWGDVTSELLDAVRLHTLLEPLSSGAKWSYRRWERPDEGGPVVGKDQPAWYRARFKHAPGAVPLFLHVVGARKGQLFLNGRNVGRFWTVGPQDYYYLPECWLEEENELLVFEEQGNIPRRSRLEVRPQGPYRP